MATDELTVAIRCDDLASSHLYAEIEELAALAGDTGDDLPPDLRARCETLEDIDRMVTFGEVGHPPTGDGMSELWLSCRLSDEARAVLDELRALRAGEATT